MHLPFKKSALLYISTAIALSVIPATNAVSFEDNDAEQERVSFNNVLVDAAENGDVVRLKSLLTAGQDPNQRGEFEATALLRAAFHGNAAAVKLLLSNGANPNLSDLGGATPLHVSIRQGYNEITDLLLKSGADVNLADSEGYTPLMRASISGQTKTLEKLIASGADTKRQNDFGETAADQAAEGNNKDMVFALLAEQEKKNAAAVTSAKIQPQELNNIATAAGQTPVVGNPLIVAQTAPVAEKPVAPPAAIITPAPKPAVVPAPSGKLEAAPAAAPKPSVKPVKPQVAEAPVQEAKPAEVAKVETNKATNAATPAAQTEEPGFFDSAMDFLFGNEQTTQPAEATAKTEESKKPEVAVAAKKTDDKISFHGVEPASGKAAAEPETAAAPTPAVEIAQLEKLKPLTESQKIYMLNFGTFTSEAEAKQRLSDIKSKTPALSKDINFKLVQKKSMGEKVYQLNAGQFDKKEQAVEKCKTYISSGVTCRPQETKILYQKPEPAPAPVAAVVPAPVVAAAPAAAAAKPQNLASNILPAPNAYSNMEPAAANAPAPSKAIKQNAKAESENFFDELAKDEEPARKPVIDPSKPKPLEYKDVKPLPSSAELEVPKIEVAVPKPAVAEIHQPTITAEIPSTNTIEVEAAKVQEASNKASELLPPAPRPAYVAAPVIEAQPAPTPLIQAEAPRPASVTVTKKPVETAIIAPAPVIVQPAPMPEIIAEAKTAQQAARPSVVVTSKRATASAMPAQPEAQSQLSSDFTYPVTPALTAPAPLAPQQVAAAQPAPAYVNPNKVVVTKRQGQSVNANNYEQTVPAVNSIAPAPSPVSAPIGTVAGDFFAGKPSVTVNQSGSSYTPPAQPQAQPYIQPQQQSFTASSPLIQPQATYVAPQAPALQPASYGSDEMWVSAKYFTNQNAARGFWNQVKMNAGGGYDNLRMRTQRGVGRDARVSAEIGPVYNQQDAQNICTAIVAQGVACDFFKSRESSRYADLQTASGGYVAGEELGSGNWSVQLGTYANRDSAVNAWGSLKNNNTVLQSLEYTVDNSADRIKLKAGNFTTPAAAENICQSLRKNYVSCIVVRASS